MVRDRVMIRLRSSLFLHLSMMSRDLARFDYVRPVVCDLRGWLLQVQLTSQYYV
ncbi:hypothetical protein [Macrococcus brunensis]|uniref:hypothetical protein n=1 Tax=Macrococcus brunensis TaxID=198483 RepID=UPI00140D0F2B|nr:hypothetical protein [Macrococcus brunensis]ULG73692.1 hypothetical protein MGG13_08285 [Macrococcus brunensis]